MPELPEVENVAIDLSNTINFNSPIAKVTLSKNQLRFPWPQKISQKLTHQSFLKVSRRAKYLILETEDYALVSHLGMTGSWRLGNEKKLHDHLVIKFKKGESLVYCDPRRFGYIDLIQKKDLKQYVRFNHLGPEPLDDEFTAEHLWLKSRGKKSKIKTFIMDQGVVVGVGNIYASEVLFLAGIKPTRQTEKVTRAQFEKLAQCIRSVLTEAIKRGGSTIRDFQYGKSQKGGFQNYFKVYGRDKKPCLQCQRPLLKLVITGRSTFYCSHCQK